VIIVVMLAGYFAGKPLFSKIGYSSEQTLSAATLNVEQEAFPR